MTTNFSRGRGTLALIGFLFAFVIWATVDLQTTDARSYVEGAISNPYRKHNYHNSGLLITAYTPPPPSFNGYNYQRTLTIDHNKVPNTDQSNFPVLISGTYSYLATVSYGGNVQNANGYDVIFTSDNGCTTKLNHEVDIYNATTGAVNYWVKLPTLSHTSDTIIYMCYGNPSITTDQSNKTGVWDSNFKGVWHLPNGSSLSANDSTSSANNGSISGAVAAAAKVGGGGDFNGSSNYIDVKAGKVDSSTTTGTVSAWVRISALDTNGAVLGYGGSGPTAPAMWGVYTRLVSGNRYFAVAGRATEGATFNTVRGSTVLTANTWYYVTYSSNGSTWKIRVNGAAAEMLTAVLGTNTGQWIGDIMPITPDKSVMGAVYAGGSYSSVNFWHGLLDEVRISNVERSDDWVATEYNNQSSPSTFYAISAATSAYAPTVSITSPTSGAVILAPASITITANAADQDGAVSKVEFFKDGAKIGEDTSSPFSFAWNNVPAGSYSLTAVATDNANATGTSAAVATVVNAAPTVSITSPANNATLPAGSTLTINATANDSDGAVSKVEFFKDGVEIGEDISSPFSFAWNNVPAGSYSLTAIATDNANATTTSAAASILVNAAPTVSISSPANNATFTGSTVTINAAASDSDGGISKIEFFRNGVEIGEDFSAPYSFAWTNVPQGTSTVTALATDGYGATTTSSAVLIHVVDFNLARLDPDNRTGGSSEDPLSRNFNWSVPLVGLQGRAGLNLGLSLSYNSLVWTRSGSHIAFNADGGFTPGFRIGFPVIQPSYYNQQVGKNAFMMMSADGSRTELRQVGSSQLYEAADSSYLLLDSSTMTLRTTDGTQLSYVWQGSDFQCTQIKDRNGNFITINYDSGRIDTVVDTLGRTINFIYTNGLLTSLRQAWTVNGASHTHTWATFTYSDLTISSNFTGLTNLGPQNGASIKVLTRVTTNDNSRFDFDYTSWGQVWKISNYAADGTTLLNYHSYNLPLNNSTAQTDCPRFTERRDWAQNWNRSGAAGGSGLPSGPEQEVLTSFSEPSSASWTLPDGTQQTGLVAQVTSPDLTYNKIYFPGIAGTSTGWHRGLASLVETYDGSTRRRQSVTTWTQDNMSLAYQLNPRVTETNVYDPAGNRARTRVTYQAVSLPEGTSCNLTQDVFEYQANATTVLRRTRTEYNLTNTYTDRHIIGLVSEKTLYEVDPNTQAETLKSKVNLQYDEAGSILGNDAPIRHDNTNYTATFLAGRGNLSNIKRYDVINTSQFTASSAKYNTAGAVVRTIDPLNHESSVSYVDSFSDGNNSRNTLAYPTTVTDADGFSSFTQYNFDFGALTRKQTPQPNVTTNTPGPIQTLTYDNIGRLERVTTLFNNAYIRYIYGPNYVETFATVNTVADEAHSIQVFDGAGRTIAGASNHPGSVGGFSGRLTLFDTMGRAIKSSNATETSVTVGSSPIQPYNWTATGDDAAAGWLYTQQTFDWKGRPRVTTNPDGTTKEASYSGCGCAGGEVVTVTDEGTINGGVSKRRQQKIYSDVLGRPVKTEILNWEGGSVYSATVNKYNARDQVTLTRQFAGPEGGGTYQDTLMTYDGYGRLETRHLPQQQVDSNNAASTDHTAWVYNTDDTIHTVTDARGAQSTYTYNNRHLVTGISYGLLSGVPTTGWSAPAPAAPVTYGYDAAANRTSMTDGLGSASYVYNQLSQTSSETRVFTGVGSYPLNYEYNLSGQLTSVTDAFNAEVGYDYDPAGRLSGITGAGFAGVSTYASNFDYRAWGGTKHVTYGNGVTVDISFNSRQQVTHFESPGVMNKNYQYYADGRLSFLTDLMNNKLDRAFSHDHTGQLVQALSGQEARGGNTTSDRPFNQTYAYDAFGHLSNRTSKSWSVNLPNTNDTYVNNRQVGSLYDADGNLLNGYRYNAAGEIAFVNLPGSDTERLVDGNGWQVKTVTTEEILEDTITTTNFYLRSTVLGGQVIDELAADGSKERGFVYLGTEVIAWQRTSGEVVWEHRDPSNSSFRATKLNGSAYGESDFDAAPAELDPTGANASVSDPYSTGPPPDGGSLIPYPSFGSPANMQTSFTLDGIPVSLDAVRHMFNPFDLLPLLAKHASRTVGYRNQGVRWGEPFKVEVVGGQRTVWYGKFDPQLAGTNFGIETPVYNSASWDAFGLLGALQDSGLNLAGPGFTDEQMKILAESLGRIRGKDCTDFINETLAKHNVGKDFNSLDKLLSKATFGRYDVNADYTNTDLGVDIHSTIIIRDKLVNRGDTAAGVGTSVFLTDKAFIRNDRYWNRDVADTPSILVHELFHIAGIDKKIVDSQQFTNAIQEHCRKSGYSNPIIIKH